MCERVVSLQRRDEMTPRENCRINEGRCVGVAESSNGWYVAATLGSFGDWAAYAIVTGERSVENALMHGSKLSPQAASNLFPWLNPAAYRI